MTYSAFIIRIKIILIISRKVVDPKALNLDPDPEFWTNLDLNLDPELCYQF